MLMSLLIGHICRTHGLCWEHTWYLFVYSVPFAVLHIDRNVHVVRQNAKPPNLIDDRWCCGVPSWTRLFNWFYYILLVESCYLYSHCPYSVFYCQFLTLTLIFKVYQLTQTYLESDRHIILFNFKPSYWMFSLPFMQAYISIDAEMPINAVNYSLLNVIIIVAIICVRGSDPCNYCKVQLCLCLGLPVLLPPCLHFSICFGDLPESIVSKSCIQFYL
jgi:hypothetical protein